jgi:hypothetical protein
MEFKLLQTLEAEIDANGNIRLLEPLQVTSPRRALVTLLTDSMPDANGSTNGVSAVTDLAREDRRRQQMEWMKANAATHGGQYVALVGAELISTGQTFREANESAHAAGRRNAFITYLPRPDEVLEMGGWL